MIKHIVVLVRNLKLSYYPMHPLKLEIMAPCLQGKMRLSQQSPLMITPMLPKRWVSYFNR